MANPHPAPPAQKLPKGRGVVILATAPETYQTLLVDVEGEADSIKLVKSEVLERGREKQYRGRTVWGSGLAVAFEAFNVAVARRLRGRMEDLWRHFSA